MYRAEAVRDDEGRPTLHNRGHRLAYLIFRTRVDARCRVVEHQYRRIEENGARYRQALPLAAGEGYSPLAQNRLVALRQALDVLVKLRDLRRPDDVIHARVGTAVRDVVGYRVGEQEHVLLHHADIPAERLQSHVANVDIVNRDRPLRHVVEARYQAGKGALAAARRSQEGDDPPRWNVEIEVLKNGSVLAVLEVHLIEPDVAGWPPHRDGVAAVLDRRLGVEHLEDARRGRHRPREVVHDHARHAERLGQDLQIEDELRELAQRHAPVDHPQPAKQQHHAERQQEDEQHERAVERVEPHRLVHVVGDGLIVDSELLLLVVGGGERLDHPRAAQVLL